MKPEISSVGWWRWSCKVAEKKVLSWNLNHSFNLIMESKSVTSKIKLIIVCSSRVDVVINGKIKKKIKTSWSQSTHYLSPEGRGGGGGKSRPLSSPFPPENHVIPKNPPSPPPPSPCFSPRRLIVTAAFVLFLIQHIILVSSPYSPS